MATNERDSREFSYRIEEFIGILGTDKRGWTKELNVIRWNRADPKYDIRDWNPEHDQMARGVTLRMEEMQKLRELIQGLSIPGIDDRQPAVSHVQGQGFGGAANGTGSSVGNSDAGTSPAGGIPAQDGADQPAAPAGEAAF